MKTALDHAWFETINILIPGAVDNSTKFPVRDSVNELQAALIGRRLHILAPKFFDLILNVVKPYAGGDYAVWPIHKLDIADKHRLLIPTTNYGNVHSLKIKDRLGDSHSLTSWGRELEGEFTIAVGPMNTIEDQGSVAVEIIFKEAPVESVEVTEQLRIYHGMITRIVELLEKLVET